MRRATRVFIGAVVLAGCGGVQDQGDDIPGIETVDPPVGPQGGGTTVSVTGSAFDFGEDTPTRVAIAGVVVEATVVDDTTITFVTPPADEGPADLVVFHGGGATVALQAFSYAAEPAVTAIDPELAGVGSTVTIHGRGFQDDLAGAVTVTIDGAELSDIRVVSDSELTATLPAPPGTAFEPVDVVVTTNNGSATLPQIFRYTKPGLLGIPNRRDGSRIFYVDPETAGVALFTRSNISFTRATVASTGEIVVMADSNVLGAAVIGILGDDGTTVDNLQPLVDVNGNLSIAGGDIAVDGDLFVYQRSGETLRRFNLQGVQQASASATPVVSGPKCIFRNNATTLFLIQGLDGALSTINKATGAVVAGATLNGPAGHFCHGATRIGSDLFVVGIDRTSGTRETTLFRLNTATAVLTEIGPLVDRDGASFRFKAVIPTPPGF